MADLKKLSNLLLFPTDSAPLLYSFVLEEIQEGWSWNASFSSLSPFPRCGRLLCTCFSIDEDTFSKAAEASLFQGSKEGIIWIFAIGYMTTLMSYHQWIAELMCFICFRGYSKTNVLLRLKNVHDLNTNRKYSMILLFCCWEMQGFLAYPGFSCPSLASLLSIFFFFLPFSALSGTIISIHWFFGITRYWGLICTPLHLFEWQSETPAAKLCNILLSWGLWLASMQISFSYAGSFHTTTGLAIGADSSVVVIYSFYIV